MLESHRFLRNGQRLLTSSQQTLGAIIVFLPIYFGSAFYGIALRLAFGHSIGLILAKTVGSARSWRLSRLKKEDADREVGARDAYFEETSAKTLTMMGTLMILVLSFFIGRWKADAMIEDALEMTFRTSNGVYDARLVARTSDVLLIIGEEGELRFVPLNAVGEVSERR